MRVFEHVPLAERTTFRIGGPAALLIECETIEDLKAAAARTRGRSLSLYPLGEGSNVLAADTPIEKAIVRLANTSVVFEDVPGATRVIASAGLHWDTLVDTVSARGWWGLENLAGIPGTVGAAPVQNIGAYGREVGEVIEWVETYDLVQGGVTRFSASDCAFAYRDSRFKREPQRCITRVAFLLAHDPAPRLEYPDLALRVSQGEALDTPARIAAAVRDIRSRKFPDLATHGTAGSFFKNPIISSAHAAALAVQYPGLPTFAAPDGTKVSLAWILDKVVGLRGYARGAVRLFEAQPLVVVAAPGATCADVDALAEDVAARVHDATRITIEREVRTLA